MSAPTRAPERRRARRRVTWAGILAGILLLVPGVAVAAPALGLPGLPLPLPFAAPEPTPNLVGGLFGGISLTDSSGIGINTYALSIGEGDLLNPLEGLINYQVNALWGVYRDVIAVCLWVLDWAFSGRIIDLLVDPVLEVGAGLQTVADQIGVVPVFLSITAGVSILGMVRGKFAMRLYDLLVALVIAGALTTVLHNPVELVAGEDGLVRSTFDVSSQIAGELDTASPPVPADQAAQTAVFADALISWPVRVINFGSGNLGECESVYQDALREGEVWYLPKDAEIKRIRDKVGECNEDFGTYADKPNLSMLRNAAGITGASLGIILLTFELVKAIILAVVGMLYQSIRLIITLFTGLLPNTARGPIATTFAAIIIDVATLVVATIFLTLYAEVLKAIMASPQITESPGMIVAGIVSLAAWVIYRRQRKALLAATGKLASWLRWMPGRGATATTAPAAAQVDWMKAANTAGQWANYFKNSQTAANTAGVSTTRYATTHTGAASNGLRVYNTRVIHDPMRGLPPGPSGPPGGTPQGPARPPPPPPHTRHPAPGRGLPPGPRGPAGAWPGGPAGPTPPTPNRGPGGAGAAALPAGGAITPEPPARPEVVFHPSSPTGGTGSDQRKVTVQQFITLGVDAAAAVASGGHSVVLKNAATALRGARALDSARRIALDHRLGK